MPDNQTGQGRVAPWYLWMVGGLAMVYFTNPPPDGFFNLPLTLFIIGFALFLFWFALFIKRRGVL